MKTQLQSDIKAAFRILQAVTEAIRELGQVPSGKLYAQLMGLMDVKTFDAIIQQLKNAGLVCENNHMLIWVEPAVKAESEAV